MTFDVEEPVEMREPYNGSYEFEDTIKSTLRRVMVNRSVAGCG